MSLKPQGRTYNISTLSTIFHERMCLLCAYCDREASARRPREILELGGDRES